MSNLNNSILALVTNFCQWKLTCLVTLFDFSTIFQKLAKIDHFWHFGILPHRHGTDWNDRTRPGKFLHIQNWFSFANSEFHGDRISSWILTRTLFDTDEIELLSQILRGYFLDLINFFSKFGCSTVGFQHLLAEQFKDPLGCVWEAFWLCIRILEAL